MARIRLPFSPRSAVARRRWGVSIRGKIAIAFFGIVCVMMAIGAFAVTSMTKAGDLVLKTYDRPLMTISFARAIHADFATMEALFARSLVATDAAQKAKLLQDLAETGSTLQDDLNVAADRATSERVSRAVGQVSKAVANWESTRTLMADASADAAQWSKLDASAETVRGQIDLLVNYAAGDGFKQRKETLAAIEDNKTVQIIGTVAAGAFAAVIMFGLASRILRPVGAASNAARRIAEGELDVPITISGSDELAALLTAMAVMRDRIREMVEKEVAQRRSAQNRLVDALEGSAEGVMLVDADGKVLLSNRELAAFLGGRDNAPQDGEALDVAMNRAVAAGTFRTMTAQQLAEIQISLRLTDPIDLELELADGRWARFSRSATRDGGVILHVSDITLMKEREQVLREAAERAEAASRAKSEFLATMSHELRTPLNAVIGFSDIIASEVMGPIGNAEYKSFANDILLSGKKLLNVINDILTLVKCESGALELDRDEVELEYLVERCADSMSEIFENASVRLETGPHVPGCVAYGDHTRLRQVVLSLLSNAAKFTPAGGEARLVAGTLPDGRVTVTVSDTGIGMKAEDIPAALSAFGQLDGGRARKYEGSGLGLTLAKAIIERHGGELKIESAPGVGTVVTAILPAPEAVARYLEMARIA